jgi:hypothetical protein
MRPQLASVLLVATVGVIGLSVRAPEASEPVHTIDSKSYWNWPEVQTALNSDYHWLCDGSFIKPAAKDIGTCITAFRCHAALQAACRRIVATERPSASSPVPRDAYSKEAQRIEACVLRLAEETPPPSDAGCRFVLAPDAGVPR